MMYRVIAGLLLWMVAGQLLAAERINSFFSDIQVFSNGDMSVTETIQVRAEGQEIKRGIYRDFPTTYKDLLGNRYTVGFDVVKVERDGLDEPYHTQAIRNGVRVYIGRKNVRLQPGVYTYTLQYRTSRQLGFFDHHDELYWNVTGNGWSFAIDHASAKVFLPDVIPVEVVAREAYTGPQGSKGQAFSSEVSDEGAYYFETTRVLAPREGISIVLSWPKGYLQAPDLSQQLAYQWQDNRALIAGGLSLLLVLAYYSLAWWRVGRDPHAGVIVTLYVPPKGFSPASMRYIQNMGYDDKTFASALIQLAIKGEIQIQERYKVYTLIRLHPSTPVALAAGENALLGALFKGADRITLKKTNHKAIKAAKQAHENSLSNDYEKQYFKTNRSWMVPGLLLSIITIVAVVLFSPSGEGRMIVAFMLVWLTFWSIGTLALLVGVLHAWKSVAHHRFVGTIRAVFTTLFSVPFLAGLIGGLWALAENSSWSIVILLVVVLSINGGFYQWLKAPTLAGRRLLDRIEGFKRYLSVAEKEELNVKFPAGKSVETFEAYLPFALALNVEQAWSEAFADELQTARNERVSGYNPVWYSGQWDAANPVAFGHNLGGALAQSIGAASQAPGSSSGSGGGGSSGGGGGGGGGGGW